MSYYPLLSLVLASFLFLSGCGNVNFFSWTHTRGGSDSTPEALTADGAAAFADATDAAGYKKAQEYYQKALDKDPNNSEAMAGVSKSAYAAAGLGFANVISNMSAGPTVPAPAPRNSSLKDMMAFVNPQYAGETDLFAGVDQSFLDNLYIASKLGVKYLRRIADGECDGRIKPTNANVNINLSISLLLNGALRLLDSNMDEHPLGPNNGGDILQLVKSGDSFKLNIKANGVYVPLETFLTYSSTTQRAALPASDVANFKLQLRIFVMYLIGSQPMDINLNTTFGADFVPEDNADGVGSKFKSKKLRGAVDYLVAAALELKLTNTKDIDELKLQFKKLADSGAGTNSNDLKSMWNTFKSF